MQEFCEFICVLENNFYDSGLIDKAHISSAIVLILLNFCIYAQKLIFLPNIGQKV